MSCGIICRTFKLYKFAEGYDGLGASEFKRRLKPAATNLDNHDPITQPFEFGLNLEH